MIRAHKIRLNPTIEQERFFNKACGVARFSYNLALDLWKWGKKTGIPDFGLMEVKRQINLFKAEQFPWMLEVGKCPMVCAIDNLATAMKNYFDGKSGKRKGTKVGFPKYKSKKNRKQSFGLINDQFVVDGNQIRIPILGWVNMAEPLRFAGKITGAVVSKVAGWWFVSITVEMDDPEPKQFAKQSTGVDVGSKTLAVLSTGEQFENQKPLRHGLKRLRQLNRGLARKVKGSNRWRKAKQKLARFHLRIDRQRADAQHKASHAIASTYAFVGIEDLHVKGMVKNRRLALAVSDVGLGEFLRQIEYKSKALGGQVVRVGRFYASSKTCNDCGHVNQSLTLSDRTWTCGGCGASHDRDWNAAKNIETEALRLIA